jgi:hypothetical protein
MFTYRHMLTHVNTHIDTNTYVLKIFVCVTLHIFQQHLFYELIYTIQEAGGNKINNFLKQDGDAKCKQTVALWEL